MGTPKSLKICFLEKVRGREAASLLMKVFGDSAGNADANVREMLTGNIDRRRISALVAIMNDRVVGIVACRKPVFSGNVFNITDLAVDPESRGQGLGHSLLHEAECFISDNWLNGKPGFASLRDATKLKNRNSKFYESAGYIRDPNPNRLPAGEPVMIKELNAEPIALRA